MDVEYFFFAMGHLFAGEFCPVCLRYLSGHGADHSGVHAHFYADLRTIWHGAGAVCGCHATELCIRAQYTPGGDDAIHRLCDRRDLCWGSNEIYFALLWVPCCRNVIGYLYTGTVTLVAQIGARTLVQLGGKIT